MYLWKGMFGNNDSQINLLIVSLKKDNEICQTRIKLKKQYLLDTKETMDTFESLVTTIVNNEQAAKINGMFLKDLQLRKRGLKQDIENLEIDYDFKQNIIDHLKNLEKS